MWLAICILLRTEKIDIRMKFYATRPFLSPCNFIVHFRNPIVVMHLIKVEIEVDRAEVPENNSLSLLSMGLFAIVFLRKLNM